MIVAVYTSGRQDWGILAPVCRAIAATPGLHLRLVAGGLHRRDGTAPTQLDDLRVDAIAGPAAQGSDDRDIARTAAATTADLAEVLPRLSADALLVVGDRTETLAAGVAATCLRLPLVHLHGGETSAGAIDDACRHALSRLAHLHLVAHPAFAARLRSWGEPGDRIIVCGAPALDGLLGCDLPARAELAGFLGCDLPQPFALLCHHPATLGDGDEIDAVLAGVLAAPVARIIATRPNLDAGGARIAAALAACRDPRLHLAADLGSRRWWGLMAHAAVLVGNSSSALIEAPCFGLPVVDVGARQQGRLALDGTMRCPADATAITAAITQAVARPHPATPHATAYGDGRAAARIAAALTAFAALPPQRRLRKNGV